MEKKSEKCKGCDILPGLEGFLACGNCPEFGNGENEKKTEKEEKGIVYDGLSGNLQASLICNQGA